MAAITRRVAAGAQQILDALMIDTTNDHNTRETAARIAKMYVSEVFAGRFTPRPAMTTFPNEKNADEIYLVGPLTVRSCCAHHFCPIEGHAWIGVIAGDRLLGLSKFARLTDWVMSRPQIQEEATMQLADEIENAIEPIALGVVVKARHACMTWRGVREPDSMMTTSVMRGLFRNNPPARAELMSLIERGK